MELHEIDRLQQEWIVSIVQGAKHALHIGCGEKYIGGAVNVDISPDPRIKPDRYCDAHELDKCFRVGEFDAVVSNHVVPSLRDPVLAFRQMAYVLEPGGVMAHVVPDWRYAPARKDFRRTFEFQPQGWYGPDEFWDVMRQVSDLFEVVELASFEEFNWSFKVRAVRL